MPNRRTTKTTRRTLTVEEEDRLKEVPLLLLDLEGQVRSILSLCEENANFACRSIKTNHKTTLNKLDFATRALLVESSVFAEVNIIFIPNVNLLIILTLYLINKEQEINIFLCK